MPPVRRPARPSSPARGRTGQHALPEDARPGPHGGSSMTTATPKTRRRRWALLSPLDIGADGDPYLDRLELVKTPLFGVYLHHIHRRDIEADPHDHPWPFASLLLAGAYTERYWPDKRDPCRWLIRRRPRWSLARITQAACLAQLPGRAA